MRAFRTFVALYCFVPVVAFGAQHTSIESYLVTFVGSDVRTVTDESATHVFGAAVWSCNGDGLCEEGNHRLGSVFVLKKVSGGFVESGRSKPFQWQESGSTPALEAVEARRTDAFEVSLTHFSPTGSHKLIFVHRNSEWILAGSELYFLRMIEEHGDEAVGDTMDKQSINYLTGKVIETHYRANEWYSERACNASRLRVSLADFDPFEEALSVYCGDDT